MTPELWKRVCEAFDTLGSLEASRRAEALQRLRSDDPQVASEVEGLLRSRGASSRQGPVEAAQQARHGGQKGLAEADAAPPQLAPSCLGPFVLGEVLGQGGMGCVYRADDPVLGREVALKRIRPELAAQPHFRQRFLREARAIAALQHDHIVPIHQIGEEAGELYFVMPLLAGESLTDRLRREHRLGPKEVIRIGLETARGLAAAHAAGLVHRDVKPSNLWLEAPGGRVKVLDFGLARDVRLGEELTPAGAGMGTPGYVAPEQALGLPVDGRADLFALGCVLYRMVTGEPAFRQNKLAGPSVAGLGAEPITRPDVPPGLGALIARLLAKDPGERPASAEDVVTALKALAEAPGAQGTDKSTLTLEPGSAGSTGGSWQTSRRRVDWRVRLTLEVGGAGLAVLAAAFLGGLAAVAILLVLGVVLLLAGIAMARAASPVGATAALARCLPGPGVGLVATSVLGGLVLWRPKPAEVAPGPLTLTLNVRVWKKEDKSRDLALDEEGALPLRAGDWMRIEARARRPVYFYVIHLDAKGHASPLYPWRDYDWSSRPEEEPRPSLNLPENPTDDGAPLEKGTAGIEAVLLLARRGPLSEAENERLAAALHWPDQAGKFDPLRGAVWLGETERFLVPADRGRPQLDRAGKMTDPVEHVRRLLRGELATLAEARRGVCYPFAGD